MRNQVPQSGARDIPDVPQPTGKTVSLVVNFGDGNVREFGPIAWRDGMTALDLLAASATRDSAVTFSQQGSGAMTFLTGIDDLANEGAGGRNWTYSVNGKAADRSFAVYELRPGDRVLWSFAAPE